MMIPFNKPFIVGKELYYIAQAVLADLHISGSGRFSRQCHAWFEKELRCRKALLTHSCTAALEMAAILCDIKPGDEVILPSFTFVSTANAFVLRGGIPVFIDIRKDTLNLDEGLIEQAITSRTKAIVPVHYAGRPCEMNRIMSIAEEHRLWVIEDAAQALLSAYNGKHLGTIGHIGCLSFHETKNIISGEGGALLLNREEFIERAEVIWEKGTNRNKFFRNLVDKYTWVDIGSSFLPSELIAAFLYAQLEHAEEIIRKRNQIYKRYIESLKPLAIQGKVALPADEIGMNCNGHIFYILTKSLEERTRLITYLADNEVNSVFHYVPLHSSPAGLKFGRTAGALSVTDRISETIMRLPIYYEMSLDETDRVTSLIASFYKKA